MKQLTRSYRYLFSTLNNPSSLKSSSPPKLIQIKVLYQDQLFTYNYPLFGKLAVNLQKSRVPLQFQCGYGCSCGTCPVRIQNKEHFQKIKSDQPITENQLAVLKQNSYDQQCTRLSCQLFVMEYFKDITFKIE